MKAATAYALLSSLGRASGTIYGGAPVLQVKRVLYLSLQQNFWRRVALAVRQEIVVRTSKEQLGHASIKITVDAYGKWLPKNQHGAAGPFWMMPESKKCRRSV